MLALASVDALEGKDGTKLMKGSEEGASLETVNLSRIVERSVLQFESRSFEKGFHLTTSIEENVEVKSNTTTLARIMQILLDNACKYVESEGTVSVALSSSSGAHTILEVSNTGEGIPQDKLPYIFDRFYRVDEVRNAADGHELGLAIAQTLARSLGAQLSAKSDDSLTTFTLTL